jgi:hypothetical protein
VTQGGTFKRKEEEGVVGSSLGMDGEFGSCFLGVSRYDNEGQKDNEEPKAEPVDERELLDVVERELLDAVEQLDAPGFLAAGPNGDPAGMTMLGTSSPRGAGRVSWPAQGAEDGCELAEGLSVNMMGLKGGQPPWCCSWHRPRHHSSRSFHVLKPCWRPSV